MTDLTLLQNKAEKLRALHAGPEMLLLPNAWDVATARLVEQAGFPAVATTSAGIAFSLGYPDGQKISPAEMLVVVTRIAAAVGVPVTADVEAGYGDSAEAAARTARAVIEAGGVGMNLEDATGDRAHPLFDLSLQIEKIHAVREAAAESKVPVVLNARTDVYLAEVGEPGGRFDESLRRLSAFRAAGADCVFVPGLKDATVIQRLVAALKCPLNILAGPGSPSVAELRQLGVARVSLGSGPMRAALGLFRRTMEELKTKGTYSTMDGAVPYAELNRIMS